MVLEPGVAEDHALFPKAGDGEEHPFRMGLVTEDYIYHFRDLSCFVREAVYIEHQYRTRDVPGANTLRTDKVFIYEVARSSGVQSALMECTLLVSVVLISIGRIIDIPWVLRVLAESRLGSFFSHFGLRGRAFLSGAKRRCVYRLTDICIDFFYIQYSKPIY